MPRSAQLGQLLERGVWKAPWMGPDGQIVLLAVTSEHQLVGVPRTLSFGSDYIAAHDAMWDLLDQLDPLTEQQSTSLRVKTLRVV